MTTDRNDWRACPLNAMHADNATHINGIHVERIMLMMFMMNSCYLSYNCSPGPQIHLPLLWKPLEQLVYEVDRSPGLHSSSLDLYWSKNLNPLDLTSIVGVFFLIPIKWN